MTDDLQSLEKEARAIRATCMQMAFDGREGHLSASMTYADVLVALYRCWMRPADAATGRSADRFILSKGHGCTALYAMLAACGRIPKESLALYNHPGGPLPNHPCEHALPEIEMSAGSLGHGLGVATGMLYGLRLRGDGARIAVLLGDGECNEGSVWEAAMFAAAQKLDNLLAIVDYNGIQAVGRSDDLMGHTDLAAKFRAFGWAAETIDGHDMEAIMDALSRVPFTPGRPTAIIMKTRMGVSFMEGDVVWHYRKPSADDLARALAELDAAPIHKDVP